MQQTMKPLKAPKKESKEFDETDLAFKEKQKKDAAALKAVWYWAINVYHFWVGKYRPVDQLVELQRATP